MYIPQDPAMLVSFINMKLRDQYTSLDDLCYDLDLDREALTERLAAAGYTFDETHCRFY